MNALVQRALDRATGQIGQDEKPVHGSNWGHPVQDYLASVNIFVPAAWCMAFIYWCFKDAANQLGIGCPLKKTGQVLAQLHNTDPKFVVKVDGPAFEFQPGDIFILDLGHGLGHCGMVISVNEDGSANTVEGNTNDTGSREGFEVAQKVRHAKLPMIAVIRF